jgi:hypothetical protein
LDLVPLLRYLNFDLQILDNQMPTPSESGPTSYLQKSGINDIDAFFFGGLYIVKFGTGYSPLNLTYSFPSAQSSWAKDYAFSSNITNEGGFKQFSDAQQIAARKAISAWGEISNLRPTEIYETSVLVGDIRIAFANLPNNLAGIANNPQRGPNGGDVWISNNYSDKSFSLGSFEYILILHELGHALGLKHPRDHTPVLPSTLDNHQFSIMSLTNSSNYNGIVFPQTPMIYDIQAIQYIYGANMNTRTEDNIYSFSPSKFEAMSIWDAGGQDTLSASNQNSNSLIDLREGRYSSIGLKNNIGIAFGVTIENAIGSIKNDIIIGNDTNNFIDGGAGNDALDGGAGNDSLYGQAGNDSLTGGLGADLLYGGAGIDTAIYSGSLGDFTLTKGTDSWAIVKSDESDSLINIERLQFADTNLALDLDGHAGQTIKLLGLLLGKDQATNKTYVGAGLKLLDDGMTHEQLMGAALDVVLGANASSLSVVELIWNNLIGPPTPADNISQYSVLIDNGAYTSAGLAIVAANHALNATNIDLVGLAQTGVEYIPYG